MMVVNIYIFNKHSSKQVFYTQTTFLTVGYTYILTIDNMNYNFIMMGEREGLLGGGGGWGLASCTQSVSYCRKYFFSLQLSA
jgi:hypothetical protein